MPICAADVSRGFLRCIIMMEQVMPAFSPASPS